MKALNTLIPAINYLNDYYNSNSESVIKTFQSLEGEKLFTTFGEKTKKHETVLKELVERTSDQVKEGHLSMYSWFDVGQTHLYIKFKICLNGEYEGRNFCHYLEKSFYIGKMENGTKFIWANTSEFEPLKKITIKDQLDKINAFKKAEEAVRIARRNVNEHLKELIR